MNKKLVVMALLGISMSISSFADSFHVFKKDWMYKEAKKLDLTDQQKTNISKISEDTYKSIQQERNDFLQIVTDINNDFKNNTMTEEKKAQYVEKETTLIKKALDTRLQERIDIYKQLTPEQQNKFSAVVDKWIEEHKD